jgi:hypothetical protein
LNAAPSNVARELGVLTANRVERKEAGQPFQFDHLTDD